MSQRDALGIRYFIATIAMRNKKREKQADKHFWETFYYMNVASGNTETPFHIEKVRFRLYDHVDDDDLVRMVSGIRSVGRVSNSRILSKNNVLAFSKNE